MKFFIMSLTLLVSSGVVAKSTPLPEFMTVHETVLEGLNDGEYQLVRIDMEETRDGHPSKSGFQAGCSLNDEPIYKLNVFKDNEDVHYQSKVAYSICHDDDVGDIEHNPCEPVTYITIDARINKKNEVQVDIPSYTLNLASFAGQSSPCADDAFSRKIIIEKKRFLK